MMNDSTVFWWVDDTCYSVDLARAFPGYRADEVTSPQLISQLAAYAKEISITTVRALELQPS